MKTIAIIPARGGSKRIPRKNIKEFMGKPMIAYAIEAAIKSNVFDEIMVSTDDAEIAEIAKQYGANIPFMRSDKTADDFATTFDVLEEVILEYQKKGIGFDNLCCIYPCVPFLTSETLFEANKNFANSEATSLVPVVKFSFPIQRAFIINQKNNVEYREPKHQFSRSQDLEPAYHDAGMFYFANIKEMLKQNRLITDKTSYIIVDEKQAQDIDTDEDWQMAELKFQLLRNKK